MARLGIFSLTADQKLVGRIRTLTLDIEACLNPIREPIGIIAPTHRVTSGEVEIGAAWKKEDQSGKEYFSVKIDDPSFPAPFVATLTASESLGEYFLTWHRPGSARHKNLQIAA
jgi:uncharacterized protein (DUF736 family)